MKKIVFSFETFFISVNLDKFECEIWIPARSTWYPQWYGSLEDLERLLKEVNHES